MADNVTLPATGSVVATDDVAGVQYQRVKLVDGLLDGQTALEFNVDDFDSGGGTDNQTLVGIAVAASGGHAAITGDVTNGLDVDVTRVTGTVAANQSQVGGNAIDVNSGSKSNGTQRVVLATDQPSLSNALPVSDNSGSLTVDAPVGTPVYAAVTPGAGGGWDNWSSPADNSNAALTTTVVTVKGSAGTLGGYIISNPNTSMAYVQFFDVSGAVTLGTTRPDMMVGIPAQSTAHIEITNGVKFANAIKMAAATTASGNSAPSTGLDTTILYK